MKARASWTIHLPRLRCPHCGKTVHQRFRGRLQLLKAGGKGDKEGREGSSSEPADRSGCGPDDQHAA